MSTRTISIAAIVVVILTAIVVWLRSDSPERRITLQFEQLEELVSKDAAETPLVSAARARKISTLFGETCEIRTEVGFLTGSMARNEVAQKAMYGRAQFSSLNLRFHDLTIELPAKDEAKVRLSVTLKGRLSGGDTAHDAQALECWLAEVNGEWLFTSLKIVQVLKP